MKKNQERSRVFRFSSKSILAVPLLAMIAGCTQDPGIDTNDRLVTGDGFMMEANANRCVHSICASGAKLQQSCDPCVQKICATDSYCCRTMWNSFCIKEVATICDQSCGGIPDMSIDAPDLSGPGPDLSCIGGIDGGGGGVGPGGGSVDHLYFAVIGDTRPSALDATASYPTAIIQKIYTDIEGMSPRPQFAIATGDYMFASLGGSQAAPQMSLYQGASHHYTGTLFAAMGNHECDGYTANNCVGKSTPNLTAFMDSLVTPLGKTLPYYSIPFDATDSSWTAKLLIVACNYWDITQRTWLASQLAKPTTYTFVVRHEPANATTGPCVNDVESLLLSNPYNLSIVGHTHHYQINGKEVVVGNGGAPLSGGVYGFTTVEQKPSGFLVTSYDYATAAAVSSTTVPF